MKTLLSIAPRWRMAIIIVAFALTAHAQMAHAQMAKSADTYNDLIRFEQTKLQELLAARPAAPSAAYNAKLFALGYRDGLSFSQGDLAVRIARAEVHQQFYTQTGDLATAAKVATALAEMRAEQAKPQH